MSNSIKQKDNSTKAKSLKVNNKDNVSKVVTKNKTTIVTGNKSNAVRKKPVIKNNNSFVHHLNKNHFLKFHYS